MAKISVTIEKFIKTKLSETDTGIIEIGRNDLANQFGCSPSQINYVLSTRFTPYKGYLIESRRGGGGYIKIVQVPMENDYFQEIVLDSIGDSISKKEANSIIQTLRDRGTIDESQLMIMKVALEDISLQRIEPEDRKYIRADLLRNMLLILMSQK